MRQLAPSPGAAPTVEGMPVYRTCCKWSHRRDITQRRTRVTGTFMLDDSKASDMQIWILLLATNQPLTVVVPGLSRPT